MNVITTSSEDNFSPLKPIHGVEAKVELENDEKSMESQTIRLIRRVHNMESMSPQPANKNTSYLNPYQPRLPFASRAIQNKPILECKRIMDLLGFSIIQHPMVHIQP